MNRLRPMLLCLLLMLGAAAACAAAWGVAESTPSAPTDAGSQPRLQLSDGLRDIDAWPAVRVLAEAEVPIDAQAALARLADFRRPDTPHANLGQRRYGVWLVLPLDLPAAARTQWVLDIDYASLDRVEVYLASGRDVRSIGTLGDHTLFADRPVRGRSHALMLNLAPGQPQALLLRAVTTSTMIMPIRLMTADRLAEREASVQLVQGLAAGIGMCLVLYALAHWLSLRDPAFLFYALMVSSVTLFFFAYHGLGPQHLWPESAWLTRNLSPFTIFPAVVGGTLFVERALQVRQWLPWLGLAMRAVAGVSVLAALAFLSGLIDYRAAQLAGTALGPLPMLLGLPAAWHRSRGGDRAAMYILFGWGIYVVGVLIMASLLRGWVELNVLTGNAFQVSALLEALTWLRVLGVRIDQIRFVAQRADREREALRSLAHTDALTGLPNRRGLQIELQSALQRARPERQLAVLMMDLDGFKAVNDRLGHDAGDELLCSVAERLRRTLRSRDIVARLGGDEFVVLADGLSSDDDARALADKLLEAFCQPFQLRGQHCQVGLTIGYTLAPSDGADETTLLQRADAAMYAGKRAGKHCVKRSMGELAMG
jgi:diguanylate cyclase (GGDEF)-like protein